MVIVARDWLARPGAPDEAIEQLARAVSIRLPGSYLALLRVSNGGEGSLPCQPYNLVLDPAEVVADAALNDQYSEFFPGFLMIGSDGAGEFIALDIRETEPWPVVAIDMTNINLKESVLPIAPSFDALLDLVGFNRAQ